MTVPAKSNSPEGKRSKDKDEDEVLRALHMADDVALGKLDKMITQLRRLDSIGTTLNEIGSRVTKAEEGLINCRATQVNWMKRLNKQTP